MCQRPQSTIMNVPHQVMRVIVLTAIGISLLSCRTAYQEKNSQGNSESKNGSHSERIVLPGPGIPPSKCRIVGTIAAIDSASRSTKADDPCSKIPCRASVRVDSVIGYGQGFPKAFSKSEEISVKFVFTLSPTRELFPNMSEFYPGLHVGSSFVADVQGSDAPMHDTSDAMGFIVYGYRSQEPVSK